MPCYDGGYSEQLKIDDVRKATRRECQTEIDMLRKRNDHLARMLCGICSRLERAGQNRDQYPQSYIKDVPNLEKWWKEHQELDRQRNKHKLFKKRVKK